MLACRKHLLQAGCDPTLPVLDDSGEVDGDMYGSILCGAVPVHIEILYT